MTDYERLSLLAFAEIIEVLTDIRHPGLYADIGARRQELVNELRVAAQEERV